MLKKISVDRWQEAQKWEKAFWDKIISSVWSVKRLNILKTIVKLIIKYDIGDDSNHWWAQQFDKYKFVPKALNNVVEFGCGPFTNLRIILKGRSAKHVFASDPLAKHYIKYKKFQLAEKYKKGEWLIDDHSLEECPFADNYFDLVVCINVLDHVMDPDLCLKNLVRVTKAGGILIFGNDLTSEQDLKNNEEELKRTESFIGHPHIFDNPEELLEYFKSFDPIILKILKREEGRSPRYHFGTLIFAGKKK